MNEPSALVIEGEPGIGKTTLWLNGVDQARRRGFTVLMARAAMAESVLAYTALADLLSDVDDTIWADLPVPQRQGLDAVFWPSQLAPGTDRRAVAAAFSAVIGRLIAKSPILLAIDDCQWLDTSSADVVAFVARRLPPGAALLCTTRTDAAAMNLQLPRPDAVRRLRLPALTVGELHQLLSARLGVTVSRPTVLRVHEVSGGNPFFAVELAREITAHESKALVGLPSSLADLVRTRVGRVGAGAEDVLLAVASLADPTLSLIADATNNAVDHVVELLAEAESQGVIVIDGNRVRFTHPLLAHGVYQAASARHRRGMHRRLAALVTEPELHARHLALSDPSGKPETIVALDSAAEIACSRGAPAAAAEMLELAMSLGADSEKREIRCAEFYFFAGDSQRARVLLESVIGRVTSRDLRAEALSLLAVVRLYGDGLIEAMELLQRALDEVDDRLPLRVPILVTLAYAQYNAGRLEFAVNTADEAVVCAERLGEPSELGRALSMRVMMHFLAGDGFDSTAMAAALDMGDNRSYTPMPLRPRMQNALMLGFTGELTGAREEMLSIARDAVASGEEGELIFPSFHHFLIEYWLGNAPEAASVADGITELAMQLGSELAHIAALTAHAWLAAHEGRESDCRQHVAAALAANQRSGTFRLTQWSIAALGFLEVSQSNYGKALDVLQPLLSAFAGTTRATEIVSAVFVPDAVEALVGLGRWEEAAPMCETLVSNGVRLDRPWMLAVGMRCRAMVLAARGDLTAASAELDSAIEQHERLPMPFERARTQLVRGQVHRRERRRLAAAAALDDALHTFERVGSVVWADRTREELARGGSGKRRADGLTPSEHRVAVLAASGMSNKRIASTLFVSPKTVEVNLSRIYRKLGIHSRIELSRMVDPLQQ
ncbi:helix-turn-helix transcriptional regulator [Mycolicibacterium sp. HS_4_1]